MFYFKQIYYTKTYLKIKTSIEKQPFVNVTKSSYFN